jgi:hypothetical protein
MGSEFAVKRFVRRSFKMGDNRRPTASSRREGGKSEGLLQISAARRKFFKFNRLIDVTIMIEPLVLDLVGIVNACIAD